MENPVITNVPTWKDLSQDYAAKVLSVSSFPKHVQEIMKHVTSGLVLDLGCGPMGNLLREVARIPGAVPVGVDFCPEMVLESRKHTGASVSYVIADNRFLPFRDSVAGAVLAINSFVPETRAEAGQMFAEAARVLRPGGRLIAVLPSFEMSLLAQQHWGIEVQLDMENRREWDTVGWQCFYTEEDIRQLMKRFGMRYQAQRIVFNEPEEIEHVQRVYFHQQGAPGERLLQYPLFEHLLVAQRP